GMAGEDDAGFAVAVPEPDVVDVAETHVLGFEARRGELLGDQRLAARVLRCDRRALDERAGGVEEVDAHGRRSCKSWTSFSFEAFEPSRLAWNRCLARRPAPCPLKPFRNISPIPFARDASRLIPVRARGPQGRARRGTADGPSPPAR